jgi:LCP family protein required for cell wall assembly
MMDEEKVNSEKDNKDAAFHVDFIKTNEDHEDVEEQLLSINADLAKHISDEMDSMSKESTKENSLEETIKEKKQKKVWWMKIQSGVVLTVLSIIGILFFLAFTKPGNNLLLSMGVNLGGTIWAAWTGDFEDGEDVAVDIDYVDDEDLSSKGQEVNPTTIIWPNTSGVGRHEEGVYNVLVLGEEAIGNGDARGRTDVIVVATINTVNKTLKLTSLMRDMLVQIPGYKDNKLNVAYETGGLDLLYETIALNLDLKLDGCVMVNFENFEKIIDEMGGLEITLTNGEADYLNSTNYISDPANRDVVEGKQLLNGNQVLGYARVRKRSTITGNNNDYGRTDRHRIILNAIFEKYKTKNKAELANLMLKYLPMITTDIDSKAFQLILNSYIDMGTMNIEQCRIPSDGTFQDNVKVRGMSVLIPDYAANIEVLHSFIFGDTMAETSPNSEVSSDAQNGSAQ